MINGVVQFNKSLRPTIASVTHLVFATFAPATLAGEENVRVARIEDG
jgi:hypothetical protein